MVFSSITFIFFFLPLVLGLYFISPGVKIKNFILLILSLLFYAWGEGELVVLMILSSLFNYGIGFWIDQSKSKKLALFIGVVVNVLVLIYYKYVGLLLGGVDTLLGTSFNDGINIALPIGISFFTFQSISYIVDVYRGEANLQRNPFKLMLYISLFPQLIAGPIVRYTQVEKELTSRKHSLEAFVQGAKRFCLGLAKKVLIANVVGEVSNELMHLPADEMYFATSWFAIIAYALHIYFDFSGYSDMAIGLGRMFGFSFPENFNYPYISKSIKEFWRRWHMTLSTWFRDYLYIPLGGNQKGLKRTYFNLFLVFFITGMWHGGTWNFVLWGLFHGLFLIIERVGFDKLLGRLFLVNHIYTLLVVLFAWVLFAIPDFDQAIQFYTSMFRGRSSSEFLTLDAYLDKEYLITGCIGVILSMPVKSSILRLKNKLNNIVVLNIWEYTALFYYLALFILSVMAVSSSTYNPFIYFRF